MAVSFSKYSAMYDLFNVLSNQDSAYTNTVGSWSNQVYQSAAQGVWFRNDFQWAQERENGKSMIAALK